MPSLLDDPLFLEACKPRAIKAPPKAKKKGKGPEGKIQDNIIAYLLGRGWLIIRINSLRRPSANGGRITAYITYWVDKITGKRKSTSSGINDVLAVKGNDGKATALFIEVKTPEEIRRPSRGMRDSQILFEKVLNQYHIDYHVVASVEDVQKVLLEVR